MSFEYPLIIIPSRKVGITSDLPDDKYSPLDELCNEIRVLRFTDPPDIKDPKILDCSIEQVSLNAFDQDYQDWFEERIKEKNLLPMYPQNLSFGSSWKDKFSESVDGRAKLLVEGFCDRSSRPSFRYTWGDYQALSYA